MPMKIHRALVRQADKLGLTGVQRDAYIYGSLNVIKKRRKGKKK